MQHYTATVRIKGIAVKTLVHADSTVHARLILQYLYGMNSVVGSPVLAEATQPKTPEQQRIDSLKANKDRANAALASERQRQKVSKAQKALQQARVTAMPKLTNILPI